MTKIEFIAFITNIDFILSYNQENYSLALKDEHGMTHEYLNISFVDDERFQLSQTKIYGGMQSGKSFGIFLLTTFGEDEDFQMEIFLSFINGAFIKETGSANSKITQYIRDNKIKDILNQNG